MDRLQMLKSKIASIQSQIDLFGDIIPDDGAVRNTKASLIHLLEEELVCARREYEMALHDAPLGLDEHAPLGHASQIDEHGVDIPERDGNETTAPETESTEARDRDTEMLQSEDSSDLSETGTSSTDSLLKMMAALQTEHSRDRWGHSRDRPKTEDKEAELDTKTEPMEARTSQEHETIQNDEKPESMEPRTPQEEHKTVGSDKKPDLIEARSAHKPKPPQDEEKDTDEEKSGKDIWKEIMDEVCDDEFNTENEGQSQRDVHVSKERMDDDDDEAYIKSLIEHTWEKPLVIKPSVDNPVVNKPLADKPLVDNPSIEKPSKRSPPGGGVGSDTYYSMHSSQCQLEKVLADDLTRKVSSRIESGGYERDSYVTAPELNMSELNEALSEQDGLIQEYTERLNQVNQELQVAKQTHKQLIRQLSHVKNEPSPMINSILKDMPPLDGKSLNRYLEELEWESYKYEPHTEIPEDVECDSAMLVENARRKYTLFNECVSKVYPQVALAPLQWECKSESTSQASAPTCCQEVKEQIHDIHMYNCEQLEEFYVRQQACLDKLKAKYATMLGELQETVRDAIEKKNAKVRYCKTLQHVMAFTETEVLVVENNIRQHYTELMLANKRLAFYLSQQRALCSEASDLIAQSEREVEEVKSLRKALCDEEHYARNLQLETECIESLLRRAQDIYCALCRSIEPLDVDIKRLMYNLVRLKKNICREKKCMRRLMKRRVQDLNKMQSMMSEIQTKQNPWKVNVGEIVEEVATKVKYEQMEEILEDVKPIGRGPCEPLIQDNDMATGTDSDAMSFAILIIT